jgi:hypothetical protein
MISASTHEQSAGPPGNDPFSFLKLIAEASAVFAGVTFVAGWSYLASYYRTFGVNPMELDVSVPVASTMALHMLYGSVWPLLTLAIGIVVFAAVAHHYANRLRGYRWWIVALLVLFLFCSATAALIRGRRNANWDMVEESSNLPLVAFSSRSEAAKLGPPEQPSCVGYQNFGAMDCKLLLHSKGLYYFFRPIAKASADQTDNVDLFMIPESEVLGIHVQRGVDLRGVEK